MKDNELHYIQGNNPHPDSIHQVQSLKWDAHVIPLNTESMK